MRSRCQTSGFNHQAFVTRFERDGEDLYPLLDAAIERDPEGLGRRVRVELYKQLGYFPTESSEHSAEYVSWFMRHDDMIERYRIPVDDYIGRTEEALEEYREIVRKLEAGEPVEVPPWNELASDIIDSIETGTPRAIYANVKNTGLIPDLPDGCCVEVPCLVDRAGVQPTAVPPRPPARVAALNRTFLNVVGTVRASHRRRSAARSTGQPCSTRTWPRRSTLDPDPRHGGRADRRARRDDPRGDPPRVDAPPLLTLHRSNPGISLRAFSP